MKLLKKILLVFLILLIFFTGFILYSTLTKYSPQETKIISSTNTPDSISTNTTINLMIWNIGYCGLGADMDFFYDGGQQTRTSKENTLANFTMVEKFLLNNDTLDFLLIQEIDKKSKRSYRINEFDSLSNLLSQHHSSFSKNYDVQFVPSPITAPLGKVKSGIASFSKNNPKSVTRYSFPGDYSWPINLFMLRRCFMVSRFPIKNGKELLIINTHNSAYDDGSLKQRQMKFLKSFLLSEFEKGNYIIAGGDWNQNPPNTSLIFSGNKNDAKRFNLNPIPSDYLSKEWTWIYDSKIATNRYLNIPFDKEKTTTTTLDFFLISPNIESLSVKAISLGFKNTDHQPVISSMKLN
ncbi:MAG: hypothetical protein PF487_08625 [Bacteroidales bacterium]|jgi:endonuclease/exonuclease/phosphatase family metal-dependent hydrolase|nr:hypothetical protein [Bacteroidales bacterium]